MAVGLASTISGCLVWLRHLAAEFTRTHRLEADATFYPVPRGCGILPQSPDQTHRLPFDPLRAVSRSNREADATSTGAYRWIRAEPPLAKACTCSTVAMLVSPGNVVSSAPWAQPRLTASCSLAPDSSP